MARVYRLERQDPEARMSGWKLSCADYTFPALDHPQALRLIADIGFDGVDIGFFAGRSHYRPEEGLGDPAAAGNHLASVAADAGLVVADLFAQISEDFRIDSINSPVEGTRDAAVETLTSCMDVAVAAGAPGMTLLPGVHHDGEEWMASFSRSVDALRGLVHEAQARELRLSFEPHVESVVDVPAKALELVQAVPGLTVTLDPAHFVFSGHELSGMEQLLTQTAHVQLRGGAPGVLQAPAAENSIEFGELLDALARAGYSGWLATEYVWSSWHGCDRVDNLTETVLLRRALLDHPGRKGEAAS